MIVDYNKLGVLNSAIDTLEILVDFSKFNFNVKKYFKFLESMFALKKRAKSIPISKNKKINDFTRVVPFFFDEDKDEDFCIIDTRNYNYKIKAVGSINYPYHIFNDDVYIKISKKGFLEFRFNPEFLICNTLQECYIFVRQFLSNLNINIMNVKTRVLRVDICKDVKGVVLDDFDNFRFRGKISSYNNAVFYNSNSVGTQHFNRGGDCQFRIYDKIAEINKLGKDKKYLLKVFTDNGFIQGDRVFRFEIQTRGSYLKSFFENNLDDEFLYLIEKNIIGAIHTEFFKTNNFYNTLTKQDIFKMSNISNANNIYNYIKKHNKNNKDSLSFWNYIRDTNNSYSANLFYNRHKKELRFNIGKKYIVNSVKSLAITSARAGYNFLEIIDETIDEINSEYIINKGLDIYEYSSLRAGKMFSSCYNANSFLTDTDKALFLQHFDYLKSSNKKYKNYEELENIRKRILVNVGLDLEQYVPNCLTVEDYEIISSMPRINKVIEAGVDADISVYANKHYYRETKFEDFYTPT